MISYRIFYPFMHICTYISNFNPHRQHKPKHTTIMTTEHDTQQAVQRYTERILPRARQSLELVRNGYRQGQVEYLTLNQSQQTFLRTNLAYLAALRQLRDTGALIESQLLHGSLANPE